jgi:hypothetical protein
MSAENRTRALSCLRLALDINVELADRNVGELRIAQLRERRDELAEEFVDEMLLAAKESARR